MLGGPWPCHLVESPNSFGANESPAHDDKEGMKRRN
jgi:hypothetical protein